MKIRNKAYLDRLFPATIDYKKRKDLFCATPAKNRFFSNEEVVARKGAILGPSW